MFFLYCLKKRKAPGKIECKRIAVPVRDNRLVHGIQLIIKPDTYFIIVWYPEVSDSVYGIKSNYCSFSVFCSQSCIILRYIFTLILQRLFLSFYCPSHK